MFAENTIDTTAKKHKALRSASILKEKYNQSKKRKEIYEDKLDLFTIRSVEEIKLRLGETCLEDKEDDNHLNAVFMMIWNKISKAYSSGSRGHITHVGPRLKEMVEVKKF